MASAGTQGSSDGVPAVGKGLRPPMPTTSKLSLRAHDGAVAGV